MKDLVRPRLMAVSCFLRSVLAALGLCCVLTPAFAQVDNFNDGNDAGWVRSDPIHEVLEAIYGPGQPTFVTWTCTNGGYRIQSDPSPAPLDLGPSRAGSFWTNAAYVYTNFYVSVDIQPWGSNTNQAIGILARIQDYSGMGQSFAYTLTYEPFVEDFQITLFNGLSANVLVVKKVSLASTNTHRMVFTGNGDALEGSIYVLPDLTTPARTISATDSTYTGGWCGLLVFSNQNEATDVTYDNYVALPEPPPALSVARVGSEVWVSWPIVQTSYTLQSSPVLPATTWTNITTGISQSGGQNIYKTTPSGQAYYRLRSN